MSPPQHIKFLFRKATSSLDESVSRQNASVSWGEVTAPPSGWAADFVFGGVEVSEDELGLVGCQLHCILQLCLYKIGMSPAVLEFVAPDEITGHQLLVRLSSGLLGD